MQLLIYLGQECLYILIYLFMCHDICALLEFVAHVLTRSARNGKRMKRKRDKALEKSNMLTILRGVCVYIYMCVCDIKHTYIFIYIYTYIYNPQI